MQGRSLSTDDGFLLITSGLATGGLNVNWKTWKTITITVRTIAVVAVGGYAIQVGADPGTALLYTVIAILAINGWDFVEVAAVFSGVQRPDDGHDDHDRDHDRADQDRERDQRDEQSIPDDKVTLAELLNAMQEHPPDEHESDEPSDRTPETGRDHDREDRNR